jgi:acyl-CoA thioester hydrolase
MHAMAKIAAAAITCRRAFIGARSKLRRHEQREVKS